MIEEKNTSEVEALRARIEQLEAALNQNSKQYTAKFRLTPSLANVLGLLVSLPYVDADTVQERLELFTNMKVAICRLRKELAPHGIEIKSRRFSGYWLDDADKQKIKALTTFEVKDAA
jgi:DNA-binding response OmpR family regulator